MPKNGGAIYQPLHPDGEIRILILEPGSKDSQICCRLAHTNLNDEPEYKALSYEWGPVDDQKLITINGEDVSVRQNLWSALWHLRQDLGDHCAQHSFLSAPWDPRKGAGGERLWIDALCINQDDKIECGNQVSMMGSIYCNADVICWLGQEDGSTNFGRIMKQLKIMSNTSGLAAPFYRDLTSDWNELNALELDQDDSHLLGGDITFPKAGKTSIATFSSWVHEPNNPDICISYTDVEALCSLGYWHRTWIIQEVVLGKNVSIRLGNISVDGTKFYILCGRILRQGLTMESLLMIPGFRILHLRRIWISQTHDLTLMKLMKFSELSLCSDLRDKVYGMIGLASDCKNGRIVPDYTKSLTEVYCDVALHALSHSCSKLQGEDRTWSNVHDSELIQRALFGLSTSRFERTSLFQDEEYKGLLQKTKLEVVGIIYGTVIGPVEPEPGDMWWAHPGFVKQIRPGILAHKSMDTGEYCSSRTSPGERNYLKAYIRRLFRVTSSEPETSPIRKFLVDSRFGGQFCYAPSDTTAGNVICRFIDSAVAAVVKAEDDGYVLVGRAMILGADQDVSVFAQGMEEQSMLRYHDGRNSIRLIVTLDELQELTSLYY